MNPLFPQQTALLPEFFISLKTRSGIISIRALGVSQDPAVRPNRQGSWYVARRFKGLKVTPPLLISRRKRSESNVTLSFMLGITSGMNWPKT
jgi:hypothetical protein